MAKKEMEWVPCRPVKKGDNRRLWGVTQADMNKIKDFKKATQKVLYDYQELRKELARFNRDFRAMWLSGLKATIPRPPVPPPPGPGGSGM